MWSVPRFYKQGTSLEVSSVKRKLEPGGSRKAIVGAVTRNRLRTLDYVL
jgi:hypothetical protein